MELRENGGPTNNLNLANAYASIIINSMQKTNRHAGRVVAGVDLTTKMFFSWRNAY